VALGLGLLLQFALALWVLVEVWPYIIQPTKHKFTVFLMEVPQPNEEVAVIVAVSMLGAIGGSVHALGSFATHIGKRDFDTAWIWWYLLRSPIGLALAVVVYFVFRAGLLNVPSAAAPTAAGAVPVAGAAATIAGATSPPNLVDSLNIYGVGAIAALAGLSSDITTRKLKEVFETLFRPGPSPRDPAPPPPPPPVVDPAAR
jgi:hypothetical protein